MPSYYYSTFKLLIINIILISTLFPFIAQANSNTEQAEGSLTVITSFPRGFTNEFRRQFVNKHPNIKIKFTKMKTGVALDYLKSIKEENAVDLFLASSPDAFELMKAEGLLESYDPESIGIPKKVAGTSINEENYYYSGFALSGFGFMWNLRYMDAKSLPIPEKWNDLTKPVYKGHVAMSSPSRSGTTHIIIETILQHYGWDDGWSIIKKMSGNLKAVTQKSLDVPKGVQQGKYGIGLVIDYYGLVSKAKQYPVSFAYPKPANFLPANIGLIQNAPNKENAKLFMDFLLSESGQNILISKKIQRLPVLPNIYNNAPASFPNPFKQKESDDKKGYDLMLSKQRYHLVNSLFDNMITFNFEALQQTNQAIQKLSAKLKIKSDYQAQALLEQAQQHLLAMPMTEEQSQDEAYLSLFTKKRKKKEDQLPEEQKAIEAEWSTAIEIHYKQAKELAEKGLEMLKDRRVSVLSK